jgi:hypothetical protein
MSKTTELVQRVMDRSAIIRGLRRIDGAIQAGVWRLDPKPPAPPAVKYALVRKVARQFGCRALIETGTYIGDMVQHSLPHFDAIHTIELAPFYYQRASRRFAKRPTVRVYHGDSGEILPSVIASLKSRAVIWLDAHWAGGITAKAALRTPIVAELETLSRHPEHVVLIDDAHAFSGEDGYPALADMEQVAKRYLPQHTFAIRNNIMELLPRDVMPANGSTESV